METQLLELTKKIKKMPDGDFRSQLHLTIPKENKRNQSSQKRILYSFPEEPRLQVQQLGYLINILHQHLLGSTIESHRDSIISIRSYGVYYLISELLEKVAADVISDQELNVNSIAWWVGALLDDQIDWNTSFDRMLQLIYYPVDNGLNDVEYLKQNSPISIFLSDVFNNNILGSTSVAYSTTPIQFITSGILCDNELMYFYRKLSSWHKNGIHPWINLLDYRSLVKCAISCYQIQRYLEIHSGWKWQKIAEVLNDIRAIRISLTTEAVTLITRPNVEQMELFYRLDIPPPKSVITD